MTARTMGASPKTRHKLSCCINATAYSFDCTRFSDLTSALREQGKNSRRTSNCVPVKTACLNTLQQLWRRSISLVSLT